MFLTDQLRRNALYCVLHILHWIVTCTVLAYAGVYLLSRSFTNSEIGMILAAGNILGFVLQPLVAGWADRSRRITPTGMIALLCFVSAILTAAAMASPDHSLSLAATFALLSAAVQTTLPLVNAYSGYLERLQTPIYYGIARGIGTAAYSLASILMGYLTADGDTLVLPMVTGLTLLLTVFFMPAFRREGPFPAAAKPQTGRGSGKPVGFLQNSRGFLFLLAGTVIIFFGHEIIACFFPQILQEIGATTEDMGILLSVASIPEIPVLCLSGSLQRRYPTTVILKITAAATGLRTLLFFLADSVALLYAAQTLEALTALFLVASINYASENIPQEHANKAQALLTAMITASGIFASATGGILIDLVSVSGTMAIGTGVTVVGLALLLFGIKDPAKNRKHLS